MTGPAVGAIGQIGFGEESVWGTGVSITKFMEFNSDIPDDMQGLINKGKL